MVNEKEKYRGVMMSYKEKAYVDCEDVLRIFKKNTKGYRGLITVKQATEELEDAIDMADYQIVEVEE